MSDTPTVRFGEDAPTPSLGIGTWAWGDRLFWGGYEEHELAEAYRAAREGGVELFDTAEVYGMGTSERLLGRFAAAERTGEDRSPLLASKFFPFPWRVTRAQLTRALKASLQRMDVERLDLYQLHWPFPPRSVETWADAMADAVEAGMVRHVGVSNYDLRQMERAQEALQRRGLRLASNQVEYSLLERRPEESGLLQACHDEGIVLIAYSPLAQGRLTGKYGPDRPMPGMRGRRYNRRLAGLAPLLTVLRELAEAHDASTPGDVEVGPAQVALAWAIGKGTLVIPGAKNARQAEQNVSTLRWSLEEDEVARLDETAGRLHRSNPS